MSPFPEIANSQATPAASSANASPPPQRGWLRPIDLAGFGGLLGYGLLAWLARQPGEPDLAAFLALSSWIALLTFGLYFWQGRRGESLPVGRLLLWALAFRLCGLLGGPFLEDDFHRYLWDAYRFASTGTPYGAAPEAFFADPGVPETFQRILDQVNYPELPTIYAPVAQMAFLLGYAIGPGSVAALQGLFILCDLLLILLLLRMAPARNVLLYAWCPLVVKEIAFTAHPDGLGVCLLIAALALAQRQRLQAAVLCLALSFAAKPFALLLAPLVLIRGRWTHWAVFVGASTALYAPFALWGGADLTTPSTFAREWQFNAAAFGLLSAWLPNLPARGLAGALFAGFWIWCWARHRRAKEAVPRGDWLYGAMLFLAPVINPWYLLWLLPFAVIHPSRWAWTASLAVLLSYVTGLNLGDQQLHPYEQPFWVRPLEFGLILLALGWDLLRRRPSGAAKGGTPCTKA